MTLSADQVFFNAANAAAASSTRVSPFASYHVHANVKIGSKAGIIDRDFAIRFSDQASVASDQGSAPPRVRAAFPAPANFDALSHFDAQGSFSLTDVSENTDFSITNIDPLQYHAPVQRTDVDVVASALSGYTVGFAPGTSSESNPMDIVLKPTRDVGPFSFREILIDAKTYLPIRADLVLSTHKEQGTLSISYEQADGNWLLSDFHLHELYRMAFFHVSYDLDASYSNYTFMRTAPNSLLASQGAGS